MNDNELFEQARKRVQKKFRGKCVRNKDVIVDQEREIQYYRERIQNMMKKTNNEESNLKNDDTIGSISIKLNLEADKAIEKLERAKQLLIDIEEKSTEIGIDLGQEKDYTTKQTYANGELVKEETTQYK